MRRPDGELRVLLVTSRETKRWVIPKGWPMKGRNASGAAAQEAFEEAGARGRVKGEKLGRYHYLKRLRDGTEAPCVVHVFPLLVDHLAETWPEQDERRREWFTPLDAANHVDEPELREILRTLEPVLATEEKPARGRKRHPKSARKRMSKKTVAALRQIVPAT